MTDLIIIGNGFDLAHGIPTKFSDFMDWELKQLDSTIEGSSSRGEALIIGTQQDVSPWTEPNISEVIFCHDFIKKLSLEHQNADWEGVEREYFKYLLTCQDLTQVRSLNDSFNKLGILFNRFIKHCVDDTFFSIDDSINAHLKKLLDEKFDKMLHKEENEKVIWLNFNYTPFAYRYYDHLISEYSAIKNSLSFINIHGSYDNPKSIVFGYGDESDPSYLPIEQKNNKEYLKYFKSFMYSRSTEYHDLIKSLKGEEYNVHIMGHSCGLSDRVLLKELLCNSNCKEIIIYYYKSKEDPHINDYTDKVMNISRVFPLERKSEMRAKIRPFPKCKPLSW